MIDYIPNEMFVNQSLTATDLTLLNNRDKQWSNTYNTVATLSSIWDKIGVYNNYTYVNASSAINFKPGTNVTFALVDSITAIDVTVNASGGSGTPGGQTTFVQYNSASTFAGSSSFIFDPTTGYVGINVAAPNSELTVGGVISATGNLFISGGQITNSTVQYITATNTAWPVPVWAKTLFVKVYGAGGGGGSGASSNVASVKVGGTGGGGGACNTSWFDVSALPSTIVITIGAGGTGGAAVAAGAGNGNNGTTGGDSAFGLLSAFGGGGGKQGLTTATNGPGGCGGGTGSRGSPGTGISALAGGFPGGATTVNAAVGGGGGAGTLGSVSNGGCAEYGGGGGGGVSATGTVRAGGSSIFGGGGGGNGGAIPANNVGGFSGGPGGISGNYNANANGGATAWTNGDNSSVVAGGGGGGGGSATTTAAGNGGIPGGGGGGGGTNSAASGSGAGGNGGRGEVRIWIFS